ncbi:N-acetylmuramoyl-L-alanine amidase [Sporosarcina sp. G11-34]|uniref:N-acetylmuramoyl-L-alanine amidase n=1 Tax=Sporosarcina sp. G11-34 TaxID=2849605 RepID=UPI0022A94264|nr:N-acetylmuramoyl-L-alanine amidase [Sporosarcina sp. G11-34]MCZ2257568.1 N-acetylmuramoyl-L-alanine amidase [Sporosarcina sp. G11-34]
MKKFLVLLCFSLIATIFVPTGQAVKANAKFVDVGSTHRAQAEIYYLVNKEIVSGVTNTRFAPDEQVTRADAAAILGRALKLDGTQRPTDFRDVGAGKSSSGYIQSLLEEKIVSGGGNGNFLPDGKLTRGEMALLISRAFGFDSRSVSTAANALMANGIAQGTADGTFGANNQIKRADFAVFMARSLETSFRVAADEKPPTPPTDSFNTKLYVNTGSSDTLNFRKGPGTSHPSISKLTNGTVVYRASTTGDWAYIKVGNQVGYVHNSYLQSTLPSTPPAKPGPGGKKLSDLVVIIDPGHGGKDPGSSGYGLLEKNVALNIGLKMNKYFEKTPIQSKMTRTGDSFPSLGERVTFARQNGGDIFVSIHTNAFNNSANGQETYYYSRTAAANTKVNESKALAIYTQHRMQEAWNLTNRGVKEGNFYVLRENTMPAVLAEVGFIDSAKDNQLMKTEASLDKMAKGLFLATLDYYYHYEGRQDVLPLYNAVNAKPSGKRH